MKLNGFRPVSTIVDITSNTFYNYTATFRKHCMIAQCPVIDWWHVQLVQERQLDGAVCTTITAVLTCNVICLSCCLRQETDCARCLVSLRCNNGTPDEKKKIACFKSLHWTRLMLRFVFGMPREPVSFQRLAKLTLWSTQTAMSRSEPPMSLLLVLAFCQ
jgi:hypothetical protein